MPSGANIVELLSFNVCFKLQSQITSKDETFWDVNLLNIKIKLMSM